MDGDGRKKNKWVKSVRSASVVPLVCPQASWEFQKYCKVDE